MDQTATIEHGQPTNMIPLSRQISNDSLITHSQPILGKRGNERKSSLVRQRKGTSDSVEYISNDLKPTSYWETMTHMIKGNIGCGMLATGVAFKNGGLLISSIMVFGIGFVAVYNQYVLVLLANRFRSQYHYHNLGFADTIGLAFENGCSVFKKLANSVRISIKLFIVLTQLGFCCTYFLFIAQSIQQILECYNLHYNVHTIMVLIFPIILMTALIRELKHIASLSTLANVSSFASFVLIFYQSTRNLPPLTERKWIGRWEDFPLAFGMIAYSMEGISLVLPLQQNMKNSDKFLGMFGVLNTSLSSAILLIWGLGFFGYYKFGEDVKPSLTYNLEANDLLTQVVISCMVLGILCTYTLQFFVPVRILLPTIKKRTFSWPFSKYHTYEYVLRIVLVFITFLTALLIPHLDLFISLVGAVGSTFLALIYSAVADIIIRQKGEFGFCCYKILVSVLSILIGVCGFLVGTTMSLNAIIKALNADMKE